MKMRRIFILEETITAVFVLLLVYTGFSKLVDYRNFEDNIYFITRRHLLSALLAIGIPVSELLIAGLLIVNRTRLAGLYAFVALLLLFTGYIVFLLLSGSNLPCSCGGLVSSLTWKQHLVFNSCFLLAGIAAILLHKNISKQHQIVSTSS